LFGKDSRPLFLVLLAAAVSCGRSEPSRPQIVLHPAASRVLPAYVEVAGLNGPDVRTLRARGLTDRDWQQVLTVRVADAPAGTPPVEGHYVVKDASVTFTPLFPFDPGRSYRVTFDTTSAVVRLPPVATVPSTVVTAIHPSADVVPENLLRMYIEFSAPMGTAGGDEFVKLVDDTTGKEVDDAFVPVGRGEFWSPDHTRYTLIFDPGRVKSGVFLNRQSGRPLRAGRRYTLRIPAEWLDGNGLPLASGYVHHFRAGAEVVAPLTLSSWRVAAPRAGTRDPLVVTFPRPLDHGILVRALSVERMRGMGPLTIDGDVALLAGDTQWSFAPDEAWLTGEYTLVAQAFLEDPEGNQIGRAFEAAFDEKNDEHAPQSYRLAFKTHD
jgi:hypothetical protein